MPVVLTSKRDGSRCFNVRGQIALCTKHGTLHAPRAVRFELDTGASYTTVKRGLLPRDLPLQEDGWLTAATGERVAVAKVPIHLYFPDGTPDQSLTVTARVLLQGKGANLLGQDLIQKLTQRDDQAEVVLGNSAAAAAVLDRPIPDPHYGNLAQSLRDLSVSVARLSEQPRCYCEWDQLRITAGPAG